MKDQHSAAANRRQLRRACYDAEVETRLGGVPEKVSVTLDPISQVQLAAALARRDRRAKRRVG
jgi:hypothetical protein